MQALQGFSNHVRHEKKKTLFLEKNIRAANEKLYFSKGFEIML
jgi:hypothetical protein